MSLVSVIIPVYNAEQYIAEAVNSAVHLNEVGELLLIEDGSNDNSLAVCMQLAALHPKIKLLSHPDNKNLGASESRNLGIKHATFELISFLDADDVYCENRFKAAIKKISANEFIDGVYCCVGYLNEPNGKKFTLQKEVNSNKLFHFLLRGTYGHFHTNGILLKKTIFEKSGYFNSELALHQDSEMWLRLAYCGTLVGGELVNPVALVRRHAGNRIWTGQSIDSKLKSYYATLNWTKQNKINMIDHFLLLRKIAKLEAAKNNKSYLKIMLLHTVRMLFQ